MNKFYLGIDLGGTRVKMGVVSDGRVIAKLVLPAQAAQGLAANLPHLRGEIDHLLSEVPGEYGTLGGIGLAFPGLVNTPEKRILSTNAKYDDAPGLDLNKWVQENWAVPFLVDNDARMAAVGEWKYGAGTDTDDLVVMTIGTGIGTSAIIEGKLLRGKHFQGGVLGGHISIALNGRPCSCGNLGCAEAYGSTWSLEETILQHELYPLSSLNGLARDFSNVFREATTGDQLALYVKQFCLDVWATAIVNLVHAYDPEVVVIGGGVLNSAEQIMPYLQEKVSKHAWTPWGTVDLRATAIPEDAGILGVVHCLQHEI